MRPNENRKACETCRILSKTEEEFKAIKNWKMLSLKLV